MKLNIRRKSFGKLNIIFFCLGIVILLTLIPAKATGKTASSEEVFKEYVSFLKEVYDVIDKNYYYPVKEEDFRKFINWFNAKIFSKVKNEKQISNFTKWRSAAYMVDYLKSPEDTFSAFFPPKPAKEYEEKVLGKKIDLGIEGELTAEGYLVTQIEPRSDAYQKGLRQEDIIKKIDGVWVTTLTDDAIKGLLTPLEGTVVRLSYIKHLTNQKKKIKVKSQEYFKQSVFMVPVNVEGVFCLEIRTFNRKTSEDMLNLLSIVDESEGPSLILDLRGNPGGPPLAAREISAFFLPPDKEFAYFQKKGRSKSMLTVPKIPKEYHYTGPLAILVNEESGSASELFSGVLQRRGRAVLMGTSTAGKVLLKSMFNFDDESMVLLVTARGHFPDGGVFDFDGLKPDEVIEDKDIDLIYFAAQYLKEHKEVDEKWHP